MNVSRKLKSWGMKKLNDQKGNSQKPVTAPLFVPRTMNGKLADNLRNTEKELNKFSRRRIKIVEEGGTTISSLLVRSDPWEGRDCGRKLCQVCKMGQGDNCYRRSVTYSNICLLCREDKKTIEYIGKTSKVHSKQPMNTWVKVKGAILKVI